jgi:tetratricopeptide (TPR) repeat protein
LAARSAAGRPRGSGESRSHDVPPVLHLLNLLLLLTFLIWTFSLGCFRSRDMDIWWHLRAGREILATKSVPRYDTYTFAAEGQDWIDLHWLFQILVATLYGAGGSEALTLASATVATLTVLLLISSQRVLGRWGLTLLLWSPAVLLMSGRFYPRPEILTLCFLATYLALVPRLKRAPRLIWVFLPLQVLWTNTQGLFVLGLIVLGVHLTEMVGRWLVWRSPALDRLFWAGVLAWIATPLINPYGWKGAVFPVVLFQRLGPEHDFYGRHIGELMSIATFIERNGIRNPYLILHLALLVAGTASFLLPLWRRRVPLARLVLWAAFAWLGLQATRNSGLFALMAGTCLVQNVQDWLPGATGPKETASWVRLSLGRLAGVLALGAAAALVLSGAWYEWVGEGRLVGLGEHPSWHAHEAARWVSKPGMPERNVAYHEGQAALVEFYMRPEQRVWCDPRLEVVPKEALAAYYELSDALRRGEPGWRRLMARLPQPCSVLLDLGTHQAAVATLLAAPEWTCIWFDDVAAVFLPEREARRLGHQSVSFEERYFALTPAACLETERVQAEHAVELARSLLERPASLRSTAVALLYTGQLHAQRLLERDVQRVHPWRLLGIASFLLWLTEASKPSPSPPGTLPDFVRDAELLRARYALNQALALAPRDFVTRAYLFQLCRLAGDPSEALRHGAVLDRRSPRTAQERELLPLLRQLFQELQQNMGRHSVPSLKEPRSLEELWKQVYTLLAAGHYEEAARWLDRYLPEGSQSAATTNPPSDALWPLVATSVKIRLLRGNPAEARQVLKRCYGSALSGAALTARASSYYAEGNFDQALRYYSDAFRTGDPSALLGIMRCLVRQQKASDALQQLVRAKQLLRDDSALTPSLSLLEEFLKRSRAGSQIR